MENTINELSFEERYYYWLMVSLGFVNELETYIDGCINSDNKVSSLIFDLYNVIRDRNELQRTLYLSFINSEDSINKSHVKNRIINFFQDQLIHRKILPNDIAMYLGAIAGKENEWHDFDMLSEEFVMVSEGIISLESAQKTLTEYLTKNSTAIV